MTLSVDLVMPVHGHAEMALQALQALDAQTLRPRTVVVDDASPDDTAARIEAGAPRVEVVRLPVNAGFAAACNAGIRHGSGDVIVLLNSDVVLAPDAVERIVAQMEADASAGSAAALLIDPEGLVDSFGIVGDVTGAGYVRYHGSRPDQARTDAPPVLGPYGALAAYRRSALDSVGLLDERIFMYGEELELALRLRAAGWGCATVTGTAGTHIGGGTVGRGSTRQRYLAGFGRGYILRVYERVRGVRALRVLVTELGVVLLRAAVSRDTASLRGRLAGWRAGAGVPARPMPVDGIDRSINTVRSIRMRSPRYWSGLTIGGTGA